MLKDVKLIRINLGSDYFIHIFAPSLRLKLFFVIISCLSGGGRKAVNRVALLKTEQR